MQGLPINSQLQISNSSAICAQLIDIQPQLRYIVIVELAVDGRTRRLGAAVANAKPTVFITGAYFFVTIVMHYGTITFLKISRL
jgi:hypothetical protein